MHEGTLTAEEHAELLALAPEKGREYGAEVERLRDHLVEIGQKANPLNLLANTILANVIGIEGEYFEPTHWGSEAHVEYAATVLSSIKRDGDLELPEASYEQVRDFVETIHQIFFVARNANLARHSLREPDRAVAPDGAPGDSLHRGVHPWAFRTPPGDRGGQDSLRRDSSFSMPSCCQLPVPD
jgi:hypothetical protein